MTSRTVTAVVVLILFLVMVTYSYPAWWLYASSVGAITTWWLWPDLKDALDWPEDDR